jgi:GT2 family glycosyltransferase
VVDLSLLVVSYNTIELAANMLHHLAKERLFHADGSPLSWEWVVVDNASPRKDPGGIAVLRELAERVPGRLIEHTENPGYAGGMNLAFAHSKGGLVLVLNPDMIFEADCVNQLVAWLERHPETGAVGPKGYWDPEWQVMLPPNILPTLGDLAGVTAATISRRSNRAYAMKRTRAAVPVWRSREPVELPMLSGCCFLMRRSLIEEIGFFDDRYPLYFEDTDLFLRIARAGRTMVMLPDARLIHLYNRSGVTHQTEAMRRYWVSRRRYYDKWYGFAGRTLFDLSRRVGESALAKRRVARPMDEIHDLGRVDARPVITFQRCEEFVFELAQDPCFLLAGGIMGQGDRWTPGESLWAMMADSTYFFRGIDLSGGGFRHMGTWSFTPTLQPSERRAQAAPAMAGP